MTDTEKQIIRDAIVLLDDALTILSAVESANPLAQVLIKLVHTVLASTKLLI